MSISQNQAQWEKFSKQDALFYIATDAENENHFWQQGEQNFETYLAPLLKKYAVRMQRALDFGCGIGRYTFPFATHFEQVIGVDIAEPMLDQARACAQKKNFFNCAFISTSEFFQLQEKIDFVYCTNVFQHIESGEDISKIIAQIAHVTRGYAYLHFDTRPSGLFYEFKNAMPDFLLPRSLRRGIRRIRRSAADVRLMLHGAGLHIIEEHHPDSEYHYFLTK